MMYQTHSKTSREAYTNLSNEESQLFTVYNLIEQSGNQGITGREISSQLNLPIGTISARITKLCDVGAVTRSNQEKKVNGRNSTLCFANNTMFAKFVSERKSRRASLKKTLKELLIKDNQGGVYLSPLDVKRLEALI
ncbi:MAG: winged helix-turn-helix transcriptional regulator [Phycisphaerales bacterium]